MRKFACVGSHGVGKTTLAIKLASECKKSGINIFLLQEQVRFSPFGLNEEMVPETSLWASHYQIAAELEAEARKFDYLIADRSPYDTFLYSKYYGLTHPFMAKARQAAFDWLQSYDKIIWVRPNMPLELDRVRGADRRYQEKIDILFDQFFSTLSEIPKEIIWTTDIFQDKSSHLSLGEWLS